MTANTAKLVADRLAVGEHVYETGSKSVSFSSKNVNILCILLSMVLLLAAFLYQVGMLLDVGWLNFWFISGQLNK